MKRKFILILILFLGLVFFVELYLVRFLDFDLNFTTVIAIGVILAFTLGSVFVFFTTFVFSFFPKLSRVRVLGIALLFALAAVGAFSLSLIVGFVQNRDLLLKGNKTSPPLVLLFLAHEDYTFQGIKGGKIEFEINSLMQLGKTYKANVQIHVLPGEMDSIFFYALSNERILRLREHKGLDMHDSLLVDSAAFIRLLDTIPVSPVIRISIIDPHKDNFEINSISEQEQVLLTMAPTVWEWSVRPKKKGEHPIYLKVTANMENENGKRDIEVYRREIRIKAKMGYLA